MNPLTLVKRIQNINSKEAALGISEDASWHAKYKESAYVFVGGIPFDLTEGDLLAVFAQYGEIVDVNLVRDKGTGKSKGFAFVAYEDQRSTNLAVDNLNGASVLGRIVRVDHVTNYKKKEEENEEEQQKKREARGVCRAFQKGECNRGAACKFSHNEQRCANTGWGAKDAEPKWKHDQHDVSSKSYRTSGNISDHIPDPQNHEQVPRFRSEEKDKRISRLEDNEQDSRRSFVRSGQERESTGKYSGRHEREADSKDWDRQGAKKRSDQEKTRQIPENDHELSRGERSARHSSEHNTKEVRDRREKKSERHDFETIPRKDHDGSREERSGKYNSERFSKDGRERRGGEKRSRYD